MVKSGFFAPRIAPTSWIRAGAGLLAMALWANLSWTFYDYSWGLQNLQEGLLSTSLYYTHTANLFIAVYFSGVALGRVSWANPRHYGHVLIIMSILCAHYWLFRGADAFWSSSLRSQFMHGALGPLLFAVYFVGLPKGEMEWKNAVTWTLFPLVYTFYGMTRGILTGKFPYSISDVDKHGFPLVLSLIAATTVSAWLFGMAIVALDKALAKGHEELNFLRYPRMTET